MAGQTLPLHDVRVIAVEQFGAGPFGSVQLADLGADVIKIEDPRAGGDVGRAIPPFAAEGDSLFFETFNRNKRSVDLDITSEAGRAVFEDLVRASDAVYSNLRGDVPARLRIRYDDLAHLNPAIVCVSVSGFGMTGPRASQPAYDHILQALGGWMSLTGEPDGPPARSGLSLVDYIGGLCGAFSLVAGVHAARRDGRGMDCDVSLFDAAIAMLTYPAVWHLNGGFTPAREPRSAHPSIVPFQLFATADGWMVVTCAKEKFWRRLVAVLERDDLADPRFEDFDARMRNRADLLAILDDVFRERTTDGWVRTLEAAGVPCAPVNDVAAALADPQTAARDMIVETDHPRFGRIRQPASPVRVGEPRAEHTRAPRRNESLDAVLKDLLHYTDEQVADLRARGAFG